LVPGGDRKVLGAAHPAAVVMEQTPVAEQQELYVALQ